MSIAATQQRFLNAAFGALMLLLVGGVTPSVIMAQETEPPVSTTETHDHHHDADTTTADVTEGATEEASEESGTESRPAFIQFHGSASLSADAYDWSATSPTFRPRMPESFLQLMMNSELRIGEFFTLPFNIMVSPQQTNVTTPWAANQSIGQFLANQMNTISIAPKYGWAQLYIGSHTPGYSELTFGDVQVFGGGIDLRPGKFRFSASAGIAQRGVEVDPAQGMRGAYEQHAFLARIGYGDETDERQVSFAVNIARMQDDTNSIHNVLQKIQIELPDSVDSSVFLKPAPIFTRHDLMPTPTEGASLSFSCRVPFGEGFSFMGEAATTNFTRDLSAATIDDEIPLLSDVMQQRISSRIDYALSGSVGFNRPEYGIAVKGLLIGPGFVALGYPQMQADRQDITVNPRLNLFENRLNITGAIGQRTNNLSGTKAETSNQLIGTATISAQVMESLSIDANYNNMGMTTNNRIDTFRIHNVTQSYSITPTYVLAGEEMTNTFSATFGVDTYNDYNIISGPENNTQTQTIAATWGMTLKEFPLNTTVALNNTHQAMAFNDVTINSATVAVGYAFAEGRLRPSVTAGWSGSSIGQEENTRISARLGVQWEATDWMTLSLSASTDRNSYTGTTTAAGDAIENYLQTSLSTRF